MGVIQFKTNIPVSHHKNNFLFFRLEAFPSWENCPHCPSPPCLQDVQTRVNQALPAVRKSVQSSTVHQKHSASYEYNFQCLRSHGKKKQKRNRWNCLSIFHSIYPKYYQVNMLSIKKTVIELFYFFGMSLKSRVVYTYSMCRFWQATTKVLKGLMWLVATRPKSADLERIIFWSWKKKATDQWSGNSNNVSKRCTAIYNFKHNLKFNVF